MAINRILVNTVEDGCVVHRVRLTSESDIQLCNEYLQQDGSWGNEICILLSVPIPNDPYFDGEHEPNY